MSPLIDSRWSLSPQSLERLLKRLHDDPEAAAQEYEVIRRKLIHFFALRGVVSCEALADETVDRVAQKLDQGEAVEHVRAYCYGIARRVLLEWEKRRVREEVAFKKLPLFTPAEASGEPLEARLACLEQCVKELPGDNGDLILAYYQGAGVSHLEGRKLLAVRLGITYDTLKTRAHRIRYRLEECLSKCLKDERQGSPMSVRSHSS